MNRYLRDHMIGRDRRYNDYRMRDGRNNYSSRGGYSRDSRRGDYARGYGRDRERIEEDYARREYDEIHQPMSERLNRTAFEYGDYTDLDYAAMDNDYHIELDEWCKDLKRQVRNPISKNEVLSKAEQMGVQFKEYDEKEFYVTVMMLMTDFPNIGQPETYIAMAKQWLEDKDAELSGSEKLSAYYYTIVKGE